MSAKSSYRTRVPGNWHLPEELRSIAVLVVIFWLAFQIVFFLYGNGDRLELESTASLMIGLVEYITRPVELTIVAAGAALCFTIYFIIREVRHLEFWHQLPIVALIALISAACFSVAVSAICKQFGVEWPALDPRFFVADTLRWLPPFGLWAGVTLALTYNSEMRERERRLALLHAQAQDARMHALRYQVNPHLLYNTLNSIGTLILDRENDLAESMVVRLSDFFRASLSSDPHSDVRLVEEIAIQQIYLGIEQMRFSDRLSYEFDIPVDVEQQPVPSLILQPLVENALKHGIAPDGPPTKLRVSASRQGDMLVLVVADNGPGTSQNPGTGVGLNNVRERLRSRFGERAVMEIENGPGRGFLVRLKVPLEL